VLRRCGVPTADLEDAVQETFLVVFRRIEQFEGRASDTTWLYAIAVRVASTTRRSQRREHARRDKAGDQMLGQPAPDPEEELTRAQASRVLDSLLEQLDDKKRTVFVLAELEGIKAAEISRILGVNVRTVHSRLRLAREGIDSAMQRLHARERGRLRVAALARREGPDPRPTRAAWAALAIRLERGDVPLLAGWEQLAVAPASKAALLLPWLATLAVGGAGLAVVAAATSGHAPADDPNRGQARRGTTPSPAETSAQARAPADATPAPPMAMVASPAPNAEESPANSPTPIATVPRAPTPTDRATPESDAPPPPTPASDLDAEVALLERARLAIRRDDAVGALAALDEHATQFPRSQLSTERTHTRITALCLAGRAADARALAGEDADAATQRVLARACD
jgi:RNA polymerase sigma-70 factor (ECF subfamily)